MLFVSFLHTHKDGGLLDILIRIPFSFTLDSIKQISNEIPRIVFCPQFSRYFSTLLILNPKFRITAVPQNSFIG